MKHIFICCIISLLIVPSFAQPCTPNPFSISFNGFSSHMVVDSASVLDITNNLTVEAWIYSAQWSPVTFQGSIVSKDGWSAGEFGYVLRAGGSGQLSFVIGGWNPNNTAASWQEALSPAGAMTVNTWYHVAGTFDGNEVKVYLNGNLVGTKAFTGTILTSAGFPMRIGMFCDTAHGQRYWNGLIDEVRVWNTARTQPELQSAMNSHLDTSLTLPGLVGYWRFNDGFVPVMQDISGYHNNATLFNCGPVAITPFNATPPQAPTISYASGSLNCNATGGPYTYQWFLDGNIINGATQASYIPGQYGNYTVKITAGNGCSATSAAFAYNTTGIATMNTIPFVTLNPVPANDKVEITSSMQIFKISLFDLNGREIKTVSTDGTYRYILTLTGLQPGIYLVKGYTKDTYWVKKLVIHD